MSEPIDIAWEWDGSAATAVLWVEGSACKLTGEPRSVRRAFEAICALRDSNAARGRMLDDLLAHARDLARRAEEATP